MLHAVYNVTAGKNRLMGASCLTRCASASGDWEPETRPQLSQITKQNETNVRYRNFAEKMHSLNGGLEVSSCFSVSFQYI